MKELERILQIWTSAEPGDSVVLATVVKTQGSSYRLPGARLLLTSSGRRAGSISGGCLEGDLLKKAWWLTESGPLVRRYDTTPEGEIGSGGFGLGCNGIIHVLLERLTVHASPVLDIIGSVRRERRPAAIAHLIAPAELVGQRLFIDPSHGITHNIADADLKSSIQSEAEAALLDSTSHLVTLDRKVEAFVEVLVPPLHLLVFGAGEDAAPLTDLAKYLGWRVSVFDGRAHYARAEKFPSADRVAVRPPDAGPGDLAIDPWTAAVLMSHSYSQDLAVLKQLAGQPLCYLGILGPRKRTNQLLEDAALDAGKLAALHSPMGLDIGADGPEQVALAAVAEIQATLNRREGGLLRDRDGAIHAAENPWVQSIVCA
ncbi:MAG TPA: XdhC family protein [Bryobacteraceae bacterium]|jgi:xanthine/CO dehydrogenase XdhC/CoxF family maturation factor|nr:XdhC family protein [Bryobacteraceae bacterium]